MILKPKWAYSIRELSIETAVREHCTTDYDSGELESLRYNLNKTVDFVAALTQTLFESGKLNRQEVLGLLTGFEEADGGE